MRGYPSDLLGPGRQAAKGAKGTPRGNERSAIFNLQSAIRDLGAPLAPLAAWRPGRPRASTRTRTIRQFGERDATMGDGDYRLLVAGRNPRFCSALYGDGGARPGGRERAERAR